MHTYNIQFIQSALILLTRFKISYRVRVPVLNDINKKFQNKIRLSTFKYLIIHY